jgi:inositol transport system substrate-binding protein
MIGRSRFVILLVAVGVAAAACSAPPSRTRTTVGVSMAYFDDNWLSILRSAMIEHGRTLPDVQLQFDDAQGDVGKQLSQIQNFIAQGASAIVVNTVDSAATPKMTRLAREAGVPLVYVNRTPSDAELPERVVFVGSDEIQGGTLEMEELARQMNYEGNVAIMVGELATHGARFRTKATEDVVAKYPRMKVIEKQVGNWQRERGLDLMNNWLTTGRPINAVASNNDEMAIGAIMAMQQAGVPAGKILVGGVDATPDALAEVAKGTMAVTVFQNARGQGVGAVDAAVKLARGEHVERFVWIPFELVTRSNYRGFLKR